VSAVVVAIATKTKTHTNWESTAKP
jgi:hypothetical protein